MTFIVVQRHKPGLEFPTSYHKTTRDGEKREWLSPHSFQNLKSHINSE